MIISFLGYCIFLRSTKINARPPKVSSLVDRLSTNVLSAISKTEINVLLTFPERYDITSSYPTSIKLWKIYLTSAIFNIRFDFKRKLVLDKVVIWWLFANITRMLLENLLLTRFKCQRFYGTTKVDAIPIVCILVLIRSHLHISQGFIYFCKWNV